MNHDNCRLCHPYRVEVIADNSGKWCGNDKRFATVDAARDYVVELGWRWTAVRACRVVDTSRDNLVVWKGQ
jgi:hypothetical protein